MVRVGHTACYGEKRIYEQDGYFGTTYFAIRDKTLDDPSVAIAYLRFDHELEIMKGTMNFIAYACITPSCIFLLLAIVVIIIYVEVGVMHKLDAA